ncbi:hypothetical protein G5B38_11495 [Pseudohalocynthiibacter aestuariivivens]|nr:hypothetical protein [Pseudohalocynthiibacter aestuariivivens]QIE46095.1 hypothetical protein G5B38_11495 [Pseudohalocynthiibacter aestuariivivens]
MSYLVKSAIATCATLLLVQMVHAEGLPRKKGYVSAQDQHRAIVDCKYQLGSPGRAKMEVVYVASPWGGDSVFRILPDRNVSSADAAWINACADEKLGRSSAPVGAQPGQGSGGKCPKNAPVIYGGGTYCIGSYR